MSLSIRKLSPALGAEIFDIDLSQPLSDITASAIEKAWYEHSILLFRNQHLSDAELVAFSKHFGELDAPPIGTSNRYWVEGFPEVLVVSNVIENGVPIGNLGAKEVTWHSDMSYEEVPPIGSILYALEVPPVGGSTEFVNMYAALEHLPSELRRKVEHLSIKHDGSVNAAGDLRLGKQPVTDVVTCPGPIHPIVRTHPKTGRQALYIGRRPNAYVCGLPVPESEEIVNELWSRAIHPDWTWRLDWQVGDIVFWDNRCTMHRRDPFDPNSRRVMHRTQLKEKLPQPPIELTPDRVLESQAV
ncbi:TauD/TfdA family dioxygenase [Leptolyngbya sp. FACHB-261]|uniref:TauD/TfdA dioxygenase family protein n=1 Tax=Leptolyngbya sp. FACHB-261 TaxID=2692806 RepID=UPI001681C5C7|nr:TauD/TfdA family dioxygenase [Leptolyngbya sp. FACHB-261]MBD2104033.1 TauD/TfdA family dioxygenase [Leptolyngbya sp. FACHB-261]